MTFYKTKMFRKINQLLKGKGADFQKGNYALTEI